MKAALLALVTDPIVALCLVAFVLALGFLVLVRTRVIPPDRAALITLAIQRHLPAAKSAAERTATPLDDLLVEFVRVELENLAPKEEKHVRRLAKKVAR